MISAGVLAGALSDVAGKLIRRRQLSPHEAKVKGNHGISDLLAVTFENRAGNACQNQTLHHPHPLYATKRAPRTSAIQRLQRPYLSKLQPYGS
jgi:hypothetical protein